MEIQDVVQATDGASPIMAAFTFLDWMVVLVYLAVVIGIGIWASRGQSSKRDYFLGGRTMPWWVVGLSIVATETSALTLIGVPAMAFGALSIKEGVLSASGGSMLFAMIVVGHLIGRLLIVWLVVPYYFKGDVYTTYQLLTRAFGPGTRRTAAGISFLGTALGAGVRVLVTAIPIMIVLRTYQATSDWGIDHAIVLILAVTLVYTTFGGIKAVVWTDMVQYFVFAGAGLFALFYIPTLLAGPLAAPSGATGWSAVAEVASSNLRWFHSGFTSGEVAAVLPTVSMEDKPWILRQLSHILAGPHNLILGLTGVPIGIVFALGFDQLNVQRILGCRSVADGRKAMVLSALLIAPQFIGFLLIGTALFTYYSLNGFQFGIMPWDPATVDAVTGIGTPKADYVFPIFIIEHMPVLMKGFLLAAILAAAMSSVSSALGAMASIAVMDFYRPFAKGTGSEKTDMLVSRIAVVVSGFLLLGVAYWSKHTASIFDLAFTLAGLTAGAVLGAFLWGMVFKKGHSVPVIAGMVASVIFMVFFNLFSRKVNPFFDGAVLNVNWPWHAPIGTLVCLLVIAALTPLFRSSSAKGIDEEAEHES